MMCQRIGRPPISIIGFGRTSVSSLMRVPRPPARITAFTLSLLGRAEAARDVVWVDVRPELADRPNLGRRPPQRVEAVQVLSLIGVEQEERPAVRGAVPGSDHVDVVRAVAEGYLARANREDLEVEPTRPGDVRGHPEVGVAPLEPLAAREALERGDVAVLHVALRLVRRGLDRQLRRSGGPEERG